MKKIIFVSFLAPIIFIQNINAQDYTLRFALGYGFYDMSSLKSFQNRIAESFYRIDIKPVQSFPPFFNYQLQFTASLAPGYYLGGSLGFTTTGGRNAVSDYSGEIKVDEIINGYNLGLLFEHNLIQNFYLTAQLYFIYSTMRVEEIVKLNDLSSSHSSKFNSIGIGIEPGFSYAVLDNPLIVRINIGLHVGFSTDFHMDDEADEILEGIHPGWSGFRASLQAGYPF